VLAIDGPKRASLSEERKNEYFAFLLINKNTSAER